MANKYTPAAIGKLVAAVAIIALGLWYIFWQVDIIPDTIPFLGYADDAIMVVVGIYVLLKLYSKHRRK